ncbi:hypothetical protein NE236_09405 [Actinoallomurus purpureus]|uniref:hypothetical protein n=1 Tax=Actinoallomurus purpureus TaxID=478114 RepID=UPI002091EE96|nr:hypothetical protein [Actinoallomurus purpureus]MCO6005200.1 hypothetical protein [Actinoallomurus purpureus]
MRSLSRLRKSIDSLTERPPSASTELLQLDFLVRKYPAAARMSLQFAEHLTVDLTAPPGWSSADLNGVPLWRWHGGRPVYVATGDRDRDQLRFIGAALSRFDRMTAEELHAYLRE